ncbi:MAG TPA: TetR family transcriptional regulator [Blastocatellia bacterium]|jgi:AcrR family transcriptional regulator|nr:TetR family transcriptional regulator [Blastocatellia bacterium]
MKSEEKNPPRRSDATKAAILAAARQRFAAEGYEKATIRAIAADAAIDPAMVMRYYGSKEKLFAAAAEFDLRLPDLTALPRGSVGRALVNHLLERWERDDTLKALLRAAVTNQGAAARMRAIFAAQLGPAIAALRGDSATAGTRAGLIATQALGLALCRYVLRLPPVVSMGRAEVIGWLGPTFQRYLTGKR